MHYKEDLIYVEHRYPNLNVRSVTSIQVRSLLDTDDPETFKLLPVQAAIDLPKKRRRRGEFQENIRNY
jgi:hypothetical protein